MICFSLVLYKHNVRDIEPLLCSISSLAEETPHIKVSLYIYDGSPSSFASPTLQQLQSRLKSVILSLAKGRNIGFGSANNNNFSRAALDSSDIFCVVNPDIRFSVGNLLPLIRWCFASTEYSCVAPLVLLEDGSTQYSAKQNPTILSLFLGRFKHLLCFPILRRYDTWHRNLMRDYTREVIFSTYLSGCFLLIPAWAFDAVGGFCSRYFLHVEDADLVRRLSAVGSTLHNPNGVVIHGWARGSHTSVRQVLSLLKSFLTYSLIWGIRLF